MEPGCSVHFSRDPISIRSPYFGKNTRLFDNLRCHGGVIKESSVFTKKRTSRDPLISIETLASLITAPRFFFSVGDYKKAGCFYQNQAYNLRRCFSRDPISILSPYFGINTLFFDINTLLDKNTLLSDNLRCHCKEPNVFIKTRPTICDAVQSSALISVKTPGSVVKKKQSVIIKEPGVFTEVRAGD